MEFLLGCNYWASNAGSDMWRRFDADVIREDVRVLSSYGVTHMRVFPNWRDFQPVMPLYGGHGTLNGYCLEGEVAAENPYYLDETMLDRFRIFLDICDEYGVRVVVGLITGWMSGRMNVPSALYGKNVLTDPVAIYFEQLFIRGFVSRFKDRGAVYAWDLGNECNCMGPANRIQAVNWTATIANAIRAEDPQRSIVSGMHGIEVNTDSSWQIRDQALWNDVLTTHPYPYFCNFTTNDAILSLRTTMHATAQNKYYAECGKKPCLAEEIGTLGPMFASEEAAAHFLRANLFSLWSNDAIGVMWWCAHEQTMLTSFPYSEYMVELELGLLRPDRSPKPVMLEIQKFANFLRSQDLRLPYAETDAVCLLTHGQRQWGVCYAAHILARQAGMNLRFAYADDGLPEADAYLLPSVKGVKVMHARQYRALRERVYQGATLYLSMDDGVLSEFEQLTGMRVLDSYLASDGGRFTLDGREYSYRTKRTFLLESVGAEVLARDHATGNPVMSEYAYGRGRVIFLNFPLEENLIDAHDAFSHGDHHLYEYAFSAQIAARPIKIFGEGVFTTLHEDRNENKMYAVAVNHTGARADIRIECGSYELERVLYGEPNAVDAYDAVVLVFALRAE